MRRAFSHSTRLLLVIILFPQYAAHFKDLHHYHREHSLSAAAFSQFSPAVPARVGTSCPHFTSQETRSEWSASSIGRQSWGLTDG